MAKKMTTADEEKGVPQEEGDLFGVRAIERGFFGGVVQSRPTSPASSRSPSISGRPVSPARSISSPGGHVGSPKTPKIPKPRPPTLKSPSSASLVSQPMRSPLGQNPVTADELYKDSASRSEISLALPSPARLRFDSSRPSTSSDNIGIARSRSPSPQPDLAPGPAPQIDLPKRGFSPAFGTDFTSEAEKTEEYSSKRVRSFSRPHSFKSVKSYRSSKTINLESVPLPNFAGKGGPSTSAHQPVDAPSATSTSPSPATNDWGTDLFSEIDNTMDESKNLTKSNSSASSKDPFADGTSLSSRSSSTSSIYSDHELPVQKPLLAPIATVRLPSGMQPPIGPEAPKPLSPVRSNFRPHNHESPMASPTRQSRPPSRPTREPQSPDIELETLNSSAFPKPPISTSGSVQKSFQQGIRPSAPKLTASSTPFDPTTKPVHVSGLAQHPPPSPPKSAQPRVPPSASRNPALRLTTDALSDLYDSYRRRSTSGVEYNGKSILPPIAISAATPTAPLSAPATQTSFSTSTRPPSPPPPPSTPSPTTAHFSLRYTSGNAKLVHLTRGLAAGQSAELVEGGEEEDGTRKLRNVTARGMNTRLVAHARGLSTEQDGGSPVSGWERVGAKEIGEEESRQRARVVDI